MNDDVDDDVRTIDRLKNGDCYLTVVCEAENILE